MRVHVRVACDYSECRMELGLFYQLLAVCKGKKLVQRLLPLLSIVSFFFPLYFVCMGGEGASMCDLRVYGGRLCVTSVCMCDIRVYGGSVYV